MAMLVLHTTGEAPQVFRLRPGVTSIGRATGRDVRIADGRISRLHAEVHWRPGQPARIVDMGSRNRTFVAEEALAPNQLTPLTDGDEVRVSEFRLTYHDTPQDSGEPTLTADSERPAVDETMLVSAARGFRTSAGGDRSTHRVELLRVLSELLARSDSTEELRHLALQHLATVVPIHHGVILEHEPGAGLRVTATHGPEVAYSQHVVDYVLERGHAALFDDAQADVRLELAASVAEHNVRCAMAAPLVADDAVLGVIYVDNTESARTFGQPDLDLLAVVAYQTAFSLRNAKLRRLRTTYERYFPPSTIRRMIDSGGDPLEPTEIVVTMLFADISGFTTMCESMDPSDVVDLLNRYFPRMSSIVFDTDGMLEKYIGDALLAAWGAPFPHTDDADRALEAAVAMQNHAQSVGLDLHIGIHTGRVAFANIGSREYLQYALVGDTTNLAARICSAAPAREIFLSDATRAALVKDWDLEPMGARPVKGRSEPVGLNRLAWQAHALGESRPYR